MYSHGLVSSVVHHVAWTLAVLALGLASLRVAAVVATGLERVVAACVVAVAAAITEALTLGLVGLGTSPVVLVAAAGATWLLARKLLPRPVPSVWSELTEWWRRLGGAGRIATGVLGGAALGWVGWQLRHPAIGFDSALYHYPDVAGWIANGRPGSQLKLSYDIPYGNYPMTDEVAMTWGASIARSWIPLALWEPALLALTAAASWVTLRNFSVTRLVAALGTATLITTPLVVDQLNEPATDLPALTWLACSAALASGAKRRPAQVVLALVAAGLAVGSKPSAAPMALAAVCLGLWRARGRLRPLAGWMALGLAGAFVVGGIWSARTLIQHGSPLWPFNAVPWGTRQPRFFAAVDTSFIQRPVATLNHRLGAYTSRLGGGWILLVAAPFVLIGAALARRWSSAVRRPLLIAAAVTLVAFLAWSAAWATGLPAARAVPGPGGWPLSTIRYLLPAIGAAVLMVALVTRAPGLVSAVGIVALVVALIWSVVADTRFGEPVTPAAIALLAGAAAGILVTSGLQIAEARLTHNRLPQLMSRGAVLLVIVVAIGALLAPIGDGYVERYSTVKKSTAPGADVLAWLRGQPGFTSHEPVAFASRTVLGQLAGDHFTHRLVLVGAHAPCRQLVSLAAHMPLVVSDTTFFLGIVGVVPYDAPGCMRSVRPAFQDGVYRVYWAGARSAHSTRTDLGRFSAALGQAVCEHTAHAL